MRVNFCVLSLSPVARVNVVLLVFLWSKSNLSPAHIEGAVFRKNCFLNCAGCVPRVLLPKIVDRIFSYRNAVAR